MMEKQKQMKVLTSLFCMQKIFVYKYRLNKLKPTLEACINNLKHIHEVDKSVHLIEMTNENFIEEWAPYNHLVT